MARTGILLLPILLAGCSSVLQRDFVVNAIDTEEKNVPCVILLDDQLVLNNKTNDPIRTPTPLKVTFKPKSDGTGYESVKLGVKSVEVSADGKVTKGLREGEESPFLEDWRSIVPNDAKQQLFILRKNKNYQ